MGEAFIKEIVKRELAHGVERVQPTQHSADQTTDAPANKQTEAEAEDCADQTEPDENVSGVCHM